LCDGDAEDLVGDVIGHQRPVIEGRLGGEFLAEGAGHEEIAGVGDEGHQRHLQIAGAGSHQRKEGVFAGAGIVHQTGHKGLHGVETGVFRGDAQRKGHHKVARGNGDAVF
jgi:hypothetical protein